MRHCASLHHTLCVCPKKTHFLGNGLTEMQANPDLTPVHPAPRPSALHIRSQGFPVHMSRT
ncbi:hypothetical protein KL86APRO_10434 [uncultured Alphaproteobacteria bacterium]|uniref:Uncharacterized protein n=1 Tax=uncultured Alphaproteobacteria bacterium TaxID=91750 RepID=A0A212J309_9PROT|nr:hypothetical protein KL86APRO_10434 [uncultured Alphaproteobacteria bacterium]